MSFIDDWRARGLLRPDQAELFSRIESGRLFSLSGELRSLLYLGALAIVAGVGGTVRRYVLDLGPLSITLALCGAAAASFGYCFSRGKPYSPGKVEQPGAAFDYVLYLGCAFLGILFGYLEAHYHLLDSYWDYYLIASAALFLWLAYRFDNRLVLALGLANLAGWFGVRLSRFDLPAFNLRHQAMVFGTGTVATGWKLGRMGIKEHFTDTYATMGLHVLFWALLWGLFESGGLSLYTVGLALLSGATIGVGLKKRRFQYFLYGAAYGYIGLSYLFTKGASDLGTVSLYFLGSSVALIVLLFTIRRRLEQNE